MALQIKKQNIALLCAVEHSYKSDARAISSCIPLGIAVLRHLLKEEGIEKSLQKTHPKMADLIVEARSDVEFMALLNECPVIDDPDDKRTKATDTANSICSTFRGSADHPYRPADNLKKYLGAYSDKYAEPLIRNLLDMTIPKEISGSIALPGIACWVMQCYAASHDYGQGPKAENLYKTKDDLRSVFRRKKSQILAAFESSEKAYGIKGAEFFGEFLDTDIEETDALSHLTDMVLSFARSGFTLIRDYAIGLANIRQGKKQAHKNLAPAPDNNAVLVYDGPAGRIEIPQTAFTSICLGQNTRWCVSAQGNDNMFDTYNESGPILMYFPRLTRTEKKQHPTYSSFKFAKAWDEEGIIRDELDDEQSIDAVTRLHDEALGALTGGALEYYRLISNFKEMKILFENDIPGNIPSHAALELHRIPALFGHPLSTQKEDYDPEALKEINVMADRYQNYGDYEEEMERVRLAEEAERQREEDIEQSQELHLEVNSYEDTRDFHHDLSSDCDDEEHDDDWDNEEKYWADNEDNNEDDPELDFSWH